MSGAPDHSEASESGRSGSCIIPVCVSQDNLRPGSRLVSGRLPKGLRAGSMVSGRRAEDCWETSIGLAGNYGPPLGVRTLDSLHVACALELRAERFWTFDERQAKLAEAVGLETAANVTLRLPVHGHRAYCGVDNPADAHGAAAAQCRDDPPACNGALDEANRDRLALSTRDHRRQDTSPLWCRRPSTAWQWLQIRSMS